MIQIDNDNSLAYLANEPTLTSIKYSKQSFKLFFESMNVREY